MNKTLKEFNLLDGVEFLENCSSDLKLEDNYDEYELYKNVFKILDKFLDDERRSCGADDAVDPGKCFTIDEDICAKTVSVEKALPCIPQKNLENISDSFINGEKEFDILSGYMKLDEISLHEPSCLHKLNRVRLIRQLVGKQGAPKDAVVLLQGGQKFYQYDTSSCYNFKQESTFFWLFGVNEPNFYGAFDLKTGTSLLFLPSLDIKLNIIGGCESDGGSENGYTLIDRLKTKYDIDQIFENDKIDQVLNNFSPEIIYLLGGCNMETGLPLLTANFPNKYSITTDMETLYPEVLKLRVYKSDGEIIQIHRASIVTTEAIKFVILKVGIGSFEFQADAIFMHYCAYSAGCNEPYGECLCSSGPIHTARFIGNKYRELRDKDLCILSMGIKHRGYGGHAAITYPISGNFTPEQEQLYDIVFNVWKNLLEMIHAGIESVKVEVWTNQLLIEQLCDSSILMGNKKDMLLDGIGKIFLPYNVVQMIGIDCYDIGGFVELENVSTDCKKSWLNTLSTNRSLDKNMVISLSVGCHFIPHLIAQALRHKSLKKYFNEEAVNRFIGIGGIKFEDTLVIKENGYDLLTSLPRSKQDLLNWVRKPVPRYISRVLQESIFIKGKSKIVIKGKYPYPHHINPLVNRKLHYLKERNDLEFDLPFDEQGKTVKPGWPCECNSISNVESSVEDIDFSDSDLLDDFLNIDPEEEPEIHELLLELREELLENFTYDWSPCFEIPEQYEIVETPYARKLQNQLFDKVHAFLSKVLGLKSRKKSICKDHGLKLKEKKSIMLTFLKCLNHSLGKEVLKKNKIEDRLPVDYTDFGKK